MFHRTCHKITRVFWAVTFLKSIRVRKNYRRKDFFSHDLDSKNTLTLSQAGMLQIQVY